jgi:release factor glutamine methyltransferase
MKIHLEMKKKPLSNINWYLQQRLRHKPLAYILQSQPFLSLDIITRPPVLIPRWETEEWTDRLIGRISTEKRVLELCTGSGCISLAMASYCTDLVIDAIDKSFAAIKIARLNQRKLNIDPRRLNFHHLDIMSDSLVRFSGYDLVICNPPYVSMSEFSSLDKSVRNWEDPRALIASDNGLEFYQRIAKCRFLFSKNAKFCFEIGDTQGKQVSKIMSDNGFINIRVEKDLRGKDRVVTGQIDN